MSTAERTVLCDGPASQQFWLGWLTLLGCTDPTNDGRRRVLDPGGRPVPRAHSAMLSKSGAFVRIVQCGDRFQILREGKRRWDLRETAPVSCLVLSMDGGVSAKDNLDRVRKTVSDRVEQWHERARRDDSGDLTIDDVQVVPVLWGTTDPAKPGLPPGQTLDRLVTSALISAAPDHGVAVQSWLDAPPHAQFLSPESYLQSFTAKWHAKDTGARFYRKVWQEPELAKRLRRRLGRIDAWRIGERVAL